MKEKRGSQVSVFRRDSGFSSVEHELVQKAVVDLHGTEALDHIDQIIITDYISDSPGFAGKAAFVLFGGALEFAEVYGRNAGDSEYKRILLDVQEGL